MLGDVERAAAHQVLLALARDPAYERDRRFDVLKVAHHGSRPQDPQLVAAAHATVALISVGAGNTYGHPAGATLALLRGSGTAAFRTDLARGHRDHPRRLEPVAGPDHPQVSGPADGCVSRPTPTDAPDCPNLGSQVSGSGSPVRPVATWSAAQAWISVLAGVWALSQSASRVALTAGTRCRSLVVTDVDGAAGGRRASAA